MRQEKMKGEKTRDEGDQMRLEDTVGDETTQEKMR